MTDLSTTMDAAVLTAPDTFELARIALPDVPPGWCLLETERTGLCGTDFSIIHGTHPRATMPLVIGHEITGRVVTAAEGSPSVGTRVVVEPLMSCGTCRPCRDGSPHVCQNLGLFGIDAAGSLAQYVAVPADALVPVGESAPLEHVALAEPLAVAIHAVAAAGLRAGDTVVVFGAGPIGVLTGLVAQQEGAAHVIVVEPSADRRAVAERLGFTTLPADDSTVSAVLAATDGGGADVVFDSAAAPPVALLLTQCARARGTIVIVGVYKAPTALDLQAVTFAELNIVGVRVYTRRDFERAVQVIEAGLLPLDRFPVQVFPLDEIDAAVRMAASSPQSLKVLVGPSGANR